jgi:hypothetical protein
LITFLEERADHGRATAFPVLAQNASTVRIAADELFVIEKYTGFNRFRKKYRQSSARAEPSGKGLSRAGAL